MQMARIFLPPKHAMQSGRAKTQKWVLENQTLPNQTSRQNRTDPLMGWSGGGDTTEQVRLHFDSAEQAIAYAEKHNILYTLETPAQRVIKPKAYADNFSPKRKIPWTH